jgi:hypothetical protein
MLRSWPCRARDRSRFPAFPPFTGVSATQTDAALPNAASCAWYAYGSDFQKSTTIGESHTANATGVADEFEFINQNDQTVGVGVSESGPNSGFSGDGSITLTNSVAGSQTYGQGVVTYVNDNTVYQEYELEYGGYSCYDEYMVQASETEGDVFKGPGTPADNPWGGCENDPLYAELGTHGSWQQDKSTAHTYSAAVNLFGFSANASDGFTANVEHIFTSTTASPNTYICAEDAGVLPANAGILYNTTG